MQALIYAHRGSSGDYPENTMEAFEAALRHKADGIEVDVQFTLDGEVVVIHDHRLERTTNGSGLVQQHTWAELRRLSAGGWFHPRYQRSRIPTLDDVLDFVQTSGTRIILELKNLLVPQPGLEQKVLERIALYGLEERAVVSSFNFHSLLIVKQLNPRMKTALLYLGHLAKPWEVGLKYGADQLHTPYEEVTPSLLKEARKHGLDVIPWTVNQKKAMRRMFQLRVDALITNHPLQAHKLQEDMPL